MQAERPVVAPYLPTGQSLVQVMLIRPFVEPKLPISHGEHTLAPVVDHWPAGQIEAVADVEPAPHLYPEMEVLVTPGTNDLTA